MAGNEGHEGTLGQDGRDSGLPHRPVLQARRDHARAGASHRRGIRGEVLSRLRGRRGHTSRPRPYPQPHRPELCQRRGRAQVSQQQKELLHGAARGVRRSLPRVRPVRHSPGRDGQATPSLRRVAGGARRTADLVQRHPAGCGRGTGAMSSATTPAARPRCKTSIRSF